MQLPWRLSLVALVTLASLGACGAVVACSGFRDAGLAPSDAPDEAAQVPDSNATDAASPFTIVQATPAGEPLIAIWGADAADVFAVGSNGLHCDYYQGSWHAYQTTLGYDFKAIWGDSASDVYAVGVVSADGIGFIEHYDGNAWTQIPFTGGPLYGVWGTPGYVLAVGADGMIYGEKPPATSWVPLSPEGGLPANPHVPASPGEPILWGIAGSSLADFAMPSDLDQIFHAENAAVTGDFVNLNPTADRTISFRSIFGVPVGNTETYFFGSNYFGVTWLTTNGPPDAPLLDDDLYNIFQDHSEAGNEQLFIYGIWGADDRFIFTGDEGRIYTYGAGPDQFTPVTSPTDAALYGVWGSSTSDVWIVGDRETILHGSIP